MMIDPINKPEHIRKELLSMAEPEYQKFASSLIPNCDNLIGVRIPKIRKIAKRIARNCPIYYLDNVSPKYFEEFMVKALVIGNMKDDIEVLLEQAALFIPEINNWSVCDSFCSEFKIVRKHKERVWDFLQKYWQSDKPYEIRVAVVMFLFHFMEQNYLEKLFSIFEQIKNENYYVKMAIAWAVSICFVNFPKETMAFLRDNHMDDETYHKTLQKIRKSLRVDRETKETIILTLR